jgi:hypothetical protein
VCWYFDTFNAATRVAAINTFQVATRVAGKYTFHAATRVSGINIFHAVTRFAGINIFPKKKLLFEVSQASPICPSGNIRIGGMPLAEKKRKHSEINLVPVPLCPPQISLGLSLRSLPGLRYDRLVIISQSEITASER